MKKHPLDYKFVQIFVFITIALFLFDGIVTYIRMYKEAKNEIWYRGIVIGHKDGS